MSNFVEELTGFITNTLTTEAKNSVVQYVVSSLESEVKPLADNVTASLKKDAETETGWCKIRDNYFLPMLISLALYAFSKIGEKVATATTEQLANENKTTVPQQEAPQQAE